MTGPTDLAMAIVALFYADGRHKPVIYLRFTALVFLFIIFFIIILRRAGPADFANDS